MLIGIEHTTELSYSGLISETVMELRMAPRQESGQPILFAALVMLRYEFRGM